MSVHVGICAQTTVACDKYWSNCARKVHRREAVETDNGVKKHNSSGSSSRKFIVSTHAFVVTQVKMPGIELVARHRSAGDHLNSVIAAQQAVMRCGIGS